MSGTDSFRGRRLYTVGHSTRSVDELMAMLRAFGVSTLVDIRTVPRSRTNPQFNRDALPRALARKAIRYMHVAELGGLRRPRPDSLNQGWRNLSFRGYADHMQSEEFEAGLAALHALGPGETLALMCAEAVPWRCHRSLVADALLARGAEVYEIASAARATPHRLTRFATVTGTEVTYGSDEPLGQPLSAIGPLHLEATVRMLQRRPVSRVDLWEERRYLRVLESEGALRLVEVANHGTLAAPDLRLRLRAGEPLALNVGVASTLRVMLGLDFDPRRLRRVAKLLPALRDTTRALRGMRPPRFASLFEAFASVVPFQQVSLDAGVAVVSRLVERFGRSLEHDGRRYHAFPSAERIAAARMPALRACGLSAKKAESLRAIARAIAAGTLSERVLGAQSTSDALRTLTELPGIGPWSANLVLLRGLGRLEVFPPGDRGVALALQSLLHLSSARELAAMIDKLGGERGLLYFCVLGSKLLERGLIRPAKAASLSNRA